MCFLYLCPLHPDLIRTSYLSFFAGQYDCPLPHFEFFLQKNLQNPICSSYLCIGFEKHPFLLPNPVKLARTFNKV